MCTQVGPTTPNLGVMQMGRKYCRKEVQCEERLLASPGLIWLNNAKSLLVPGVLWAHWHGHLLALLLAQCRTVQVQRVSLVPLVTLWTSQLPIFRSHLCPDGSVQSQGEAEDDLGSEVLLGVSLQSQSGFLVCTTGRTSQAGCAAENSPCS